MSKPPPTRAVTCICHGLTRIISATAPRAWTSAADILVSLARPRCGSNEVIWKPGNCSANWAARRSPSDGFTSVCKVTILVDLVRSPPG